MIKEYKQYNAMNKQNPAEMSVISLYREVAKILRPDLNGSEPHRLGKILISAKEKAERGDRTELEELYKKYSAENGSLVSLHA
jgi:hypothetical protein